MVSTRCLQYFCFAYNVLYAVTGIGLLVCSGILLYRLWQYKLFIPNEVFEPIWVLFGIGLAVIITWWLGWKAASRMHRPHVIMFLVVIVIVILSEISISIWSFIEYHSFSYKARIIMEKSFQDHRINVKVRDMYDTAMWNRIQSDLRCCGYDGPSGYKENLPTSCCVYVLGPDGEKRSSCPDIYQRGCYQPHVDYISKQILNSSGLGMAVVALQICGIFCYFHFNKGLKRDHLETQQAQPAAEHLVNRRQSRIQSIS